MRMQFSFDDCRLYQFNSHSTGKLMWPCEYNSVELQLHSCIRSIELADRLPYRPLAIRLIRYRIENPTRMQFDIEYVL
jgi:hypothetical protein